MMFRADMLSVQELSTHLWFVTSGEAVRSTVIDVSMVRQEDLRGLVVHKFPGQLSPHQRGTVFVLACS